MAFRQTPSGAVAAYAPASEGPFRCDHCAYFVTTSMACRKAEVVAEFKAHLNLARSATLAPVDAGACCNYFTTR